MRATMHKYRAALDADVLSYYNWNTIGLARMSAVHSAADVQRP
jgi:hypothetical protein